MQIRLYTLIINNKVYNVSENDIRKLPRKTKFWIFLFWGIFCWWCLFVWGRSMVVLRDYSKLCAQGSLLVGFRSLLVLKDHFLWGFPYAEVGNKRVSHMPGKCLTCCAILWSKGLVINRMFLEKTTQEVKGHDSQKKSLSGPRASTGLKSNALYMAIPNLRHYTHWVKR